MSNIVVYIDIIISILVSEAFALTLLYVCYMLYCLYPFMASLIGKASSKRSTYKLLILTLAGIILAITLLYSAGKVFPAHYAYAQQQQSLIGGVNIPVNIDVTAIVPININIQNAQICLQVAGGSCSQVVLNPTQTTYSPTTVDLTQPTPTITPTTITPTTTSTQTTSSTTNPLAPTTTPSSPTTTTPTNPVVPASPTQNALTNAAPQAQSHIPTNPTQNVPSPSSSSPSNNGGGQKGGGGGSAGTGSSSGGSGSASK